MTVTALIAEDEPLLRDELEEHLRKLWPELEIIGKAGDGIDALRLLVAHNPAVKIDDMDFFVDRLWAVYYPALALQRVPRVLPHENGQILWAAVRHILTPRLFFPDKPNIASDSDMVRKYSGVWVAGAEVDTSIAFGYAAEAYVDFAVPLMFLPILVWGLLLGWLSGWPWERTLAYANAVGAIVVTRHGCSVAIPTRAEVEAFLTQRGLSW